MGDQEIASQRCSASPRDLSGCAFVVAFRVETRKGRIQRNARQRVSSREEGDDAADDDDAGESERV